jgi:hypothetical protein
MRQRGAQTREREEDHSRTSLASPLLAASRRPAAPAAIAALLVMALGVALFAMLSTHRSAPGTTGASTAATHAATLSPATAVSPLRAPRHGAGLPEGVEVITFTPTGTDEGWGTGGVNINQADGFPDRGMVLHYAASSWTQVGAALPGIYLGGIDMVSSSVGWAMGSDGGGQYLLLHISNGAWQQVALPADPGAAPAIMAMRTPDEGWLAMANQKGAQGGANTSLFHDTGGTWSLVRNPLKYITDIAPVADGEAWIIGWNTDGTSSLVHVRGGVATVELTSPSQSTFSRLRLFAPNDVWIEGAMHAASNADVDDVPLAFHFDGAAWSQVNLHVPNGVQHLGIVASQTVWGLASVEPASSNRTRYGQIASIYANVGGQWQALSVPYKDLQSMTVVSNSDTDVWAVGVYMVTTQLPNHNGAPSYASVSHSVLLRYGGGTWTEYGR